MNPQEIFYQSVREKDYVEAQLVDRAYNRLRDSGYVGDLTRVAIAEINQSLSHPGSKEYQDNPELQYPLAGQYGYETIKQAHRWWNYRIAVVEDIKHEDSRREMHLNEQIEAGEMLLAADPVFISAFASLDETRMKFSMSRLELQDPLYEEKQRMGQLLLNTLDRALQTPPFEPDLYPGHSIKRGSVYDGQDHFSFMLERIDAEEWGVVYQLEMDKPGAQFEDFGIERIPYIIISVGDTPTDLTFEGRYGIESLAQDMSDPDIITLAKLARMMSPDMHFNPDRPPFKFKP